MKFLYSFLIVLSSIVVSFSAQQQKKALGIKIGPYLSTIRYYVKANDDSKTQTFDTKASPSVSFFFDLPQNKTITHSFNLNYYNNRGEDDFSTPLYSRSYTISVQYLGFGYTFKGNAHFERFTPYFLGGITFDFLIDFDRDGYNAILTTINGKIPIDEDELDPFTARVILGGGVEYSLDRVSLLLEYNFSYNLIPFYSEKSDDESIRYNYSAFGSMLSFGVKIPF